MMTSQQSFLVVKIPVMTVNDRWWAVILSALTVYWTKYPSHFSMADVFQLLDTVLSKILNITSDHLCHCIKSHAIPSVYIILYLQLEKVLQISLKFKNKLEFLINSSVQIHLIQIEFLRNSIIFRRSHWRCSIQKAVLKIFMIFTGK